MKTLRFFVKRHIIDWFPLGKDLEVRVGSDLTDSIQVGDKIILNNSLTFEVVAIRVYSNFEDILETEDPNRIAPGYRKEVILNELQKVYKGRKWKRIMIFELKKPERKRQFLYAQ